MYLAIANSESTASESIRAWLEEWKSALFSSKPISLTQIFICQRPGDGVINSRNQPIFYLLRKRFFHLEHVSAIFFAGCQTFFFSISKSSMHISWKKGIHPNVGADTIKLKKKNQQLPALWVNNSWILFWTMSSTTLYALRCDARHISGAVFQDNALKVLWVFPVCATWRGIVF